MARLAACGTLLRPRKTLAKRRLRRHAPNLGCREGDMHPSLPEKKCEKPKACCLKKPFLTNAPQDL